MQKTQLFDDFDTDFYSGSDNSDDNNVGELVPLLNNIYNDDFDGEMSNDD